MHIRTRPWYLFTHPSMTIIKKADNKQISQECGLLESSYTTVHTTAAWENSLAVPQKAGTELNGDWLLMDMGFLRGGG